MIIAVRVSCLTALLAVSCSRALGEEFTSAIRAFLEQRVAVEGREVGVVIGIVDEHGSRVVSCGKMDNGTGREVDGDTLFELGSITKTFTALLLEQMIEQGEMKLEDPVAKHLPGTFKMPAHNGKEITLLHLVTHTSGLPLLPDNLGAKRADNPFAAYTVEKLRAYLAGYRLTRDPGKKYEYSEVGMQLLGHVIAVKGGRDYESLLSERICRPLKMASTRITLTPELKARCATGHDPLGNAVPGLSFAGLVGGSGLHSTANDLLKFVSAELGLTRSGLTPLMEKTHVVRFDCALKGLHVASPWAVVHYPRGTDLMMHGGATPGFTAFVAFDKSRRRGAVVLASSVDLSEVGRLGQFLLLGEWEADKRPRAGKIQSLDYERYVGEYELRPDIALGTLGIRAFLANGPKGAIGIAGGCCAAGVAVLGWRVGFLRRRCARMAGRWRGMGLGKRLVVAGSVAGAGVILALVAAMAVGQVICALAHPVVNIRREGSRLFAQATSSTRVASRWELPHLTGELLPESEACFFERLSGARLRFYRDGRGRVTALSGSLFGTGLSFKKTSERAPEFPSRRPSIKLDARLYDGYAGRYEFGPDRLFPAGINLTIWRAGDGLVGRASGKEGTWGTFDIYAQTETNFFFTLSIVGVDLRFKKDAKGEVTSVVRHVAGLPDREAKKIGDARLE